MVRVQKPAQLEKNMSVRCISKTGLGLATIMLAVLVLSAGPLPATEAAEEAPVCKRAEINPVTGHIVCLDPRGAAVEAPPDELKPACDKKRIGQPFAWGPNCLPDKG